MRHQIGQSIRRRPVLVIFTLLAFVLISGIMAANMSSAQAGKLGDTEYGLPSHLVTAPTANQVVNGDFETGNTSPFTTSVQSGSAAITSNPSFVHTGSFAAQVTIGPNNNFSGVAGGGNCSGGNRIPVSPNTPYTWSGWLLVPTGAVITNTKIMVAWFTSCTSGSSLSTDNSKTINAPTGTYTQVTGLALSPPTAAFAEIQLLAKAPATATLSVYFDDITFDVSAITPTPTRTSTPSSPTSTRTPTNTRTATNTPTITPTDTATNTPTPYPTCGPGSEYVIEAGSGGTIDPGTTDTGNHCNDCVTGITLPFTYNFYGVPYTSIKASSNGNLQFSSTSSSSHANTCLPTSILTDTILADWDDLDTRSAITTTFAPGIYTSISGSVGSQVFNIEWRTCRANGGACDNGYANFEVRLYEGQDRFDIEYGHIAGRGNNSTVGVQRGNGAGPFGSFTQYECNAGGLTSGLQLTFRPYACGEPTFTPTFTPASTHTQTSTRTPTLSPTITPTDTVTNTPTDTDTPTSLPTNTPTNTATVMPTNTPIDTATNTPISTPTDTPTETVTPTFTAVSTETATNTPTFVVTPTSVLTDIPTDTRTETPLVTSTPAFTYTPAPTDTPANTFTTTPVPTNTSTPTPGPAIVTGHVVWQGRPTQPDPLQVLPISLTLKMDTNEVNYIGLTTDSRGNFTVTVDLPSGAYGWRAKGPKFLANSGTVSIVRNTTVHIEIGLMLVGDADNSNRVDILDFGLLRNSVGRGVGDPGYDDRADFNGDQRITISDFQLLKNNFSQIGASPLGPFRR